MASLGLTETEREAIAQFERDVIQPSMDGLVILDFWAEWCGPCKQLAPVLEKVAADYAAKAVKLVKIDVDADKLIAAQFQIQSIPTVYAFHQGRPVADLTNYRSEGQLKKALDQLLSQLRIEGEDAAQQAEIEPLIAMGEQLLNEGQADRAVAFFQQIRDMAPEHPEAVGGMARALITAGRPNEARELIESLPEEVAAQGPVSRAKAALELSEAAPADDSSALQERVASNPDDLDAKFELAGVLAARGDRDGAADALLDIIARDKDWNEEAARKRLLQLIEAQGLEDPWGRTQRRRLSALLFT